VEGGAGLRPGYLVADPAAVGEPAARFGILAGDEQKAARRHGGDVLGRGDGRRRQPEALGPTGAGARPAASPGGHG
jgi:hypothetical protein